MWREFKPAIRFVLWFVGLYFAGNIVYGLWITALGKNPDFATVAVAKQAAWLLQLGGHEVIAVINAQGPTVFLKSGEATILNIYEGCNGINVFIVFIAFLVAFGGSWKKLSWFLPLGLVILYGSNLLRIAMLYWTAVSHHRYFYFVHKYVFTAIIYGVVLVLWIFWVNQRDDRKAIPHAV